MFCPECHGTIDDREERCRHCDHSPTPPVQCARCREYNRPGSRFCDQCGTLLSAANDDRAAAHSSSERRYVTILFSDISRYREIILRVDPEEIREVTRHLFMEIGRYVQRYGGHVDRILWDGVLAVFGVPHTHEDDAVRAIRSGLDIKRMAARLERQYANRIGGVLAVRSGIATGMVVTGSMGRKSGRQGLTGDAVNLAARLRDLASPGEVLVDHRTWGMAAGFFDFQARRPVMVKGRRQPVAAYRVNAATPQPKKVRRVHGLKARLIARERELDRMTMASVRLRRREGTVLTVCGDAGTGKSRLIAEFKDAVSSGIRWIDGYAYAYTQAFPYFPFIDLLNRLFTIGEAAPDATIRSKLHEGVAVLVDDPDAIVPFLAGLYAAAPLENIAAGPEIYQARLRQAFVELLSAIARKGPLVVCIEDLHWADPSSLALIDFILKASGLPILFVLSFRPIPGFAIPGETTGGLSYAHEHIRLTDLDPTSSREMLCSLMGTTVIPKALDRYVVNRAEGNPFYLEEIVNALIDADDLKRTGDGWQFDADLDGVASSATLHGIIHGRLDRLGSNARTVLQEAAVIGRVFRRSMLLRITAHPDECDACLERIARLDLIRRTPETREPVYRFKHAIVQEVVYNSLLKKARGAIHGKIARFLETRYRSCRDGAVETLALHYANSDCAAKAAEYLIRSGEKSLERYAVEESHRYYERAYRCLNGILQPTANDRAMLIDLIVKWFFAFNKMGLFREMLDLLRCHEDQVRDFGDPLRTGMYEMCIGWALQRRERVSESYTYLSQALATGRALGDDTLIAYSCACLCWTCTDLGRMDEALAHGRQAAVVADRIPTDHELIRFNLTGMGLRHFFAGDVDACWRTGEALIAFGESAGDARTFSEGYLLMGSARMSAGDFAQAESLLEKAIAVAVDPIYSLNARFFLSYVYFSQGKVADAAQTLEAVIAATDRFGYEYVGTSAKAFYGIVTATMGRPGAGVAMIRERIAIHRARGKTNHELIFTHMLGRYYLALVHGQRPPTIGSLIRNAGLLLYHRLVAARLAERYLKRAIAIGDRINARQRLAMACLDLGRLYAHKKRREAGRRYIERSIVLFERCGAERMLEEAHATLVGLAG